MLGEDANFQMLRHTLDEMEAYSEGARSHLITQGTDATVRAMLELARYWQMVNRIALHAEKLYDAQEQAYRTRMPPKHLYIDHMDGKTKVGGGD